MGRQSIRTKSLSEGNFDVRCYDRMIKLLPVAAISIAAGSATHAADQIVRLVSIQNGKCLQPVGGSTVQGMAIVQETCNRNSSSHW